MRKTNENKQSQSTKECGKSSNKNCGKSSGAKNCGKSTKNCK